MEKDVLEKYQMDSRDDAVRFLKSLWNETPQPCPLCEGKLDFLHKKAKKSNCDWICTICCYSFMDLSAPRIDILKYMIREHWQKREYLSM